MALGSWPFCSQLAGVSGLQLHTFRNSPVKLIAECSSQNEHASVYPRVEQDSVVWFWPDTRPKVEDIAGRKPPPSVPAFTDPAFKDKLNLPYGDEKIIENHPERAYLTFGHDEPQVDLLEDFEKHPSSTAGHPSNEHSTARADKANKKQHVSRNMYGHAQEAENLPSKKTKAVQNGSANTKLERSYSAVQNGAPDRSTGSHNKSNGSLNALMELSYVDVQNGGPCGRTDMTNGSASTKMEIPYEAKQSGALDSSTSIHSTTDGSATEVENSVSSIITEAVEGGSDNVKSASAYATSQKGTDGSSTIVLGDNSEQLTEGGLQSGKLVSQSLLGDSVKEEVWRTGRIELASRSSTSRGEADVGGVQSAVVVKKPVASARTKFEEKVSGMIDASNFSSVISESNKPVRDGSSVSCLDLESSLQALRRLIFRKDFELAKGRVKELYEKYPRDTGVLMEYAFVEKQFGDLVAAGSLYSKAISAFEDQQNLGYDYVRALQALGSIEARARNARRARVLFMESIRAARQAEHIFPDLVSGASVYGLHAWSQLELQLGNWAKARELLARAADIQPGNAVVHQSRARLEAKAHNWGAARHHFSLAVESAPEDVKCWHAWAIFEASQGKQKKMRELFHKALEVDPYSVHCLQAWAHQETLLGTPESKDKARSLLQRCTEIEPKSLYAWQAWAVLEKNSGNHDKARELFGKCLEINPSSVACLQAYANMERHLKNWGAANGLLRKALKLEPENAAVLMEAAFVENSLGNAEVAERLFVLAGMADKRKSRVTNRIFASRKEVMPYKAGRGWRASKKKAQKRSTDFKAAVDAVEIKQEPPSNNPITERNSNPIKVAVDASKTKQEVNSHSIMQRQSSSHSKHRDNNNYSNFHTVAGAIKAKQRDVIRNSDGESQPSFHLKQKAPTSTNFQVAIDAIKTKQRELRSRERQIMNQREKKSRSDFKATIDKIEAKFTELNHDMEMEEQQCFPLKRVESASSMLGA